jgi:hypothetical protein
MRRSLSNVLEDVVLEEKQDVVGELCSGAVPKHPTSKSGRRSSVMALLEAVTTYPNSNLDQYTFTRANTQWTQDWFAPSAGAQSTGRVKSWSVSNIEDVDTREMARMLRKMRTTYKRWKVPIMVLFMAVFLNMLWKEHTTTALLCLLSHFLLLWCII